MADTASADIRQAITTVGAADPTKRDFLKLLTGFGVVIGAVQRWSGPSSTA